MDTPLMMGKGETVVGRVDLPVVCGDMDSASRKIEELRKRVEELEERLYTTQVSTSIVYRQERDLPSASGKKGTGFLLDIPMIWMG